jgi:signal transduction histidine kinase
MIRILLLEDSPTDAELVRYALRQGGLNFTLEHVDNKAAFVERLEATPPDLVLSDFSLPSLDGYEALALARERCPDVPLIFVTGTLGEEVAIETLKKGATDYVLKHRLSRLVPSVHRAMREAKERRERKRAEEQLRLSHAQLRSLSMYLQDVREEERTHIAREVHDELGQALTGLKLQLTWLSSRLPPNPKPLQEKAKDMASCIDDTIQTIRRIATELRPGVLDTAGLPAAIEWQAHQFQIQTGIQCRVKTTVQDADWNQDLNTAFFRIFQETLTNIIRHAGATRVEVRLSEDDGWLELQIKDNGRGISEAQIHNTKSIGLLGMRERAALLGGEVVWRGQSGKGTTVTVRLPKPAPARQSRNRIHENSTHRRPRFGPARLETHTR